MKQFLNTTLLIFSLFLYPQEDLLSEIDNGNQDAAYEIAIFKGLKVINFESTKLVANKGFSFIVSHRFGTVKDGFQNLFGLDQAVTHLNFVYGISENVNISASRSSNQKIYELGSKIRLVKQRKGENPFNIVVYSSVLANTGLDKDNLPKLEFKHRLSYVAQLLVSRKMNSKLSFILSPTFFHDNYISNDYQNNSQYGIGFGGRYKIGKRWSLNTEYGVHLNRSNNSLYNNPFSIGVDLETGGHVFQLHFTNSQSMNTNGVFGTSTGDWTEGDVYFGFNLARSF
ncbi:MAG: DUF5777 family beta-barrel protein [Flavobacteriaceae bacterium]|nr:DUF5777 family beta-barrel protein [Flavobacteriaceae bacterium]|tara:strand:- start:510 stop:1361 length:852 start_codon:yes stop_codon:yes gene_type:complete